MIPQAAPMLRLQRYREAAESAVARVLSGSSLILGPAVDLFEAAFAEYTGLAHVVGVNSGTDAIAFSLRALGVGEGDEVITTALTAAGTAHAILHCGATPRFVDVDPATWVLDPEAVGAAIGPRTRAIVLVHLYGYPGPARVLRDLARQRGILLVEDCAQAHGTFLEEGGAGTFGDAAAYSFYPTKNLGSAGDGGAVATNNPDVAARVRALRSYGWTGQDRVSSTVGFNSRLDEIQAAILTELLPHLPEGNAERREGAAYYRDRFNGLPLGLPSDAAGAVYHQFAITHPQRDRLADILRKDFGIGTAVHYTPPLHLQPAFQGAGRPSLPHTERLARELLSLPIQPELVGPHGIQIADAVVESLDRV
jgi:dTDP-3-amino-3,4,6-trideoxy-alpha-D-glucose transaminase